MSKPPSLNTDKNFMKLAGGLTSYPLNNAVDPNKIGTVQLQPSGDFEAGSYLSLIHI